MRLKVWRDVVPDELWKVEILKDDKRQVLDLMWVLSSILTDAGGDLEKGLAFIRTLSGAQIVDALEAYKKTLLTSIAKWECVNAETTPTLP